MNTGRIDSRHNLRFKQWRQFVEHPESRECPWIPIQNLKHATDLSRHLPIELLLCCDGGNRNVDLLRDASRKTVEMPFRLLDTLSSLRSSQGFVAFFRKPCWDWDQITPFLLYLWRIQDPGNLGTLIRSADATGLFSVATSPGTASLFNEKTIRASGVSLFSVPFYQGISPGAIRALGRPITVAVPSGGASLFEARLTAPHVVLIGSEGGGVDPELLALSDQALSIPMRESAESLNAAMAGTLVCYEVYRRCLGTIRLGSLNL